MRLERLIFSQEVSKSERTSPIVFWRVFGTGEVIIFILCFAYTYSSLRGGETRTKYRRNYDSERRSRKLWKLLSTRKSFRYGDFSIRSSLRDTYTVLYRKYKKRLYTRRIFRCNYDSKVLRIMREKKVDL